MFTTLSRRIQKKLALIVAVAAACIPITVTCTPYLDGAVIVDWAGSYYGADPYYYDYYDPYVVDDGCCGDWFGFDFYYDGW
jgi:hypothetical protein